MCCIMGYMIKHQKWFRDLVDEATERFAAERAGITTSTLNRQLKAGTLSAENVIALARAFQSCPVKALAQTGYLTIEETTGRAAEATAQLLSGRELIRELARRIDDEPGAWVGTFDEVLDASKVDSLDARRKAAHDAAVDDDVILDGIKAEREPVAAQEATEEIVEDFS